jgi:hypothetical protein
MADHVDRLMQPIEGSHCVAGDELILFPSPNAMVTKLGKVLFPKCSQTINGVRSALDES